MKKTYQKPVAVKREKLELVTARPVGTGKGKEIKPL